MAIKKPCYNCSGGGTVTTYDGEQVPSEVECPVCAGEGTLEFAEIELEEGVYATYKISEATDATEYNALTDGQKAVYHIILSMGTVDLSDGISVRATLFAFFDENSTTRANLLTLIGE